MKAKSLGQAVLHVFLVASLTGLVLAGCSGAKETAQETAAASQGTSTASSAAGETGQNGLPLVNEPITIKMMVLKNDWDKSTWQDKEVFKKAQRETGITLDITEIPGISWEEKVAVTVASGDMPDVIVGGMPNFSMYTDNFMPLNDLIEQNAPVLVDLYQKHPELKFAATFPDGNIYALPLLQTLGSKVGVSFAINKAWLDALNLPIPQTVDELYLTLKAFKEKDPNRNGKQDEIPYSFYNDSSYGLDPMLWNFGLVSEDNVMVENNKVLFVPSDNRYYEYLKFMHKLYAEGLMDADGFVQKDADFLTKGTNDLIGFFSHHSYDDIVVGKENSKNYVAVLPMKNPNGSITMIGNKVAGDFNNEKVVINKKFKHADAFLKLYDYLNKDFDSRMLFAFGPENVTWKKVDGDKWEKNTQLPEGYNSYAEFRHTMSPGMSGFFLLTDEDYAKLNITDPRDVKLKQKSELYLPYLTYEGIPMGYDTIEVTQRRSKMSTEINTYLSNFVAQSIMKGIDDAKWELHLSTLKKLNVDQFVADYQALVERSIASK